MNIMSWLRFAVLTACLASIGLPLNVVRAQQDDAPAKSNDKLYNTLRDVINQGADLYNAGDRNGSYRLFQGALLTLKAQLADSPELQKMIDSGMAQAETQPSVGHRAFALRSVLVDVRSRVGPKGGAVAEKLAPPAEKPAPEPKVEKPEPKPEPKVEKPDEKPAVKTLWDRLGGAKGVTKVVDDFVEAAKDDPKVNLTRGGKVELDDEKVAMLKKHVVAYMSKISGGNIKYEGKNMKDAHKGMAITNDEFDAAAMHLRKALEDNKVADDDIDAVIQAADATRKDIVETKAAAKPDDDDKKPEPKKPAAKVDDDDKKPEPKKPAAKVDDDDKKPEPKKPAAKVDEPADAGGTGTVNGKVMIGGKVLPEAEVYLIPKANLDDKGFAALGEKDGSFEILEVKSGEYVVVVKSDDEKAGIPKAYNDPKTSPLNVKVKKGDNKMDIDIKAEKE